MSYQLAIDVTPGYLHARVTGENSVETVLQYLAGVRQACIAHSRTKVLVEENLRGPSLDLVTIFRVIAGNAAQDAVLGLRIAYVDTNPEHVVDRRQFAETVAVNRGIQVRVFESVAEAEAWL